MSMYRISSTAPTMESDDEARFEPNYGGGTPTSSNGDSPSRLAENTWIRHPAPSAVAAECRICLQNLDLSGSGENPGVCISCGHTFHYECIHEWMNVKSDCPICRKDFPYNAVQKLRVNLKETELTRRQDEVDSLEHQLGDTEEQCRELERQCLANEEQLSSLKNQMNREESNKQHMKCQLAINKSRQQTLRNKLSVIAMNKLKLNRKLAAVSEELKVKKMENQYLSRQVRDKETANKSLSHKLRVQVLENNNLQKNLLTIDEEMIAMQTAHSTKISKSAKKGKELEERLVQSAVQRRGMIAEKQALQTQLDMKTATLNSYSRELTDAKAKNDGLQEIVNSHVEEVHQLEQYLALKDEQNDSLENSLSFEQAKVVDLEHKLSTNTNQVDKLKRALSLKDNKINHLQRVLETKQKLVLRMQGKNTVSPQEGSMGKRKSDNRENSPVAKRVKSVLGGAINKPPLHKTLNVGVYSYHPKPAKMFGSEWARIIDNSFFLDNF